MPNNSIFRESIHVHSEIIKQHFDHLKKNHLNLLTPIIDNYHR